MEQSNPKWNVKFTIYRKKGNGKPYQQSFDLEVDPDEYVLDGIERIWAQQDRSLTYRHACHHSTCGACGMLINGVEKLTCITTIRSVTKDNGEIRVAPLRNFPVVSDLVVDMSEFFRRLEDAHARQVIPADQAGTGDEEVDASTGGYERLADCIECGLCISACPAAHTSEEYLGPAVLAAAQQSFSITHDLTLLNYADNENGAWRCHSAYECTAVCPSHVDPAWRIMNLRRKVVGNRIQQLFKKTGS